VGHNQDIGLQFEESPETLGRSWVITVLNKIGMQSKVFNQRKFTRAVANLPVEIEMPTKEIVQGTALDIGLGGALIATERPFTPTTRFNIAVGPLGNHEKLKIRAEVIQSRHDEEKGHWGQSVKFIEMGPNQTKLLGKYVVDLLKTSGSV
jgi:c-di-GMP-binding flagellar brake protein YcgR